MFNYFHENKCKYENGQVAPFFILIIVILIIMTMVTVNLSKVAFIKTESSNAVDAGALAAGSVMANIFNVIAQANSQMESDYWEFYASISISFAIAIVYLTIAYIKATAADTAAAAAEVQACPSPCTALITTGTAITAATASVAALKSLTTQIEAIMVAITAFDIGQLFFYKIIKRIGTQGRDEAIKLGHKFVFFNSGISAKLKYDQRDDFTSFTDGLGSDTTYTYNWNDGEGRGHWVSSTVQIDPVEKYNLQTTLFPLPAELGLLLVADFAAYAAKASMALAILKYTAAAVALAIACGCQVAFFICAACCGLLHPVCCVCAATNLACWGASCAIAMALLGVGITANTAALVSMVPIFITLPIAWLGLLPGPVLPSAMVDSGIFTICWIDSIDHNRLVRVDSTQHHDKSSDLVLWQFRYPDDTGNISSYSVVSFLGNGQIHPPVLRHDASIVETDAH